VRTIPIINRSEGEVKNNINDYIILPNDWLEVLRWIL
jgi:hypothetical protein